MASFFDRLKALIRPPPAEKAVTFTSWAEFIGLEDGRERVGSAYSSIARRAYRENPIGYGALTTIAETLSVIPWTVKLRRSNDEDEDAPDSHPMMALLRRPNARQGWPRFLEQLVTYAYLGGKTYVAKARVPGEEAERPEGRAVRALVNLRPDRMRMRVDGDDTQGWIYSAGIGRDRQYAATEVLVLRFLDPEDELDGLSPLEVAGIAIDQSSAARKWNRRLLENDARPPGFLKATQELTPEQRQSITRNWSERFGGWRNAGTPPLLGADLDWKRTGLDASEMEWLDGQRVADRTAAYTLGVPSQLLGDERSSTYHNYQEARRSLYQETVIPLALWLTDEFENWLSSEPGFEGMTLGVDTSEIEALREDQASLWSRVSGADWLTINEKREAAGYEPLEGPAGELLLTSKGVVVLPTGQVLGPLALAPLGSGSGGGGEGDDDSDESERQPPPDRGGDGGDSAAPSPFDLRRKEDKVARWRAVDSERMLFVDPVRGIVRRAFDSERRKLVASFRALASADSVDQLLDAQFLETGPVATAWRDPYIRIYRLVGMHFARESVRALPKHLVSALSRKQDTDDIVEDAIEDYVRTTSSRKIVGITRATRDAVREALSKGVEAGEGIDKLAARIDNLYLEQIIPNRSEVIARTEVISASNAGSYEGARATGIVTRKEWIATPDDRTRAEHAEAGGQVVDMDAPFRVGGEQLMWPGDTSLGASAANVIQCRCTLTYQTG